MITLPPSAKLEPSSAIDSVRPAPPSRAARRDLRFLRWYAHTVARVMSRYTADASTMLASKEPGELLGRVERELAAESCRMRAMLRAILIVSAMPLLLAAFLWSGLYWLPVRILWFPFERGAYGLPLLSLYEWFSFLFLASFAVYSTVAIVEGLASAHRVSADFHHLAVADGSVRIAIAREARSGDFSRSAFVLTHAKPFAQYASLMVAPAENPSDPV